MNSLDLIAGLIIGGFLVGVVSKGKTTDLIALAKRDAGFLKWALALAALFYARQLPDISGVMSGLIAAAILAFLLFNVEVISKNAAQVWDAL